MSGEKGMELAARKGSRKEDAWLFLFAGRSTVLLCDGLGYRETQTIRVEPHKKGFDVAAHQLT